ncbi:hypothetical protein Scep_003909 [Stephania cephalantha]|uniref:Uncharacterized protein n=1 Tax=Stephania cephalantha TaxID=152367 RepID=A0AAP0KTZ0_9MAGN
MVVMVKVEGGGSDSGSGEKGYRGGPVNEDGGRDDDGSRGSGCGDDSHLWWRTSRPGLVTLDPHKYDNLSFTRQGRQHEWTELAEELEADIQSEKLGRPPTALEVCLYFDTKDHDDITFLDERVEMIVMTIRNRPIELSQSQVDTPIDETELYLSVVERDDKGQTYGLGWTPSGSWLRHVGARAGDGAGSSRPISAPNEPIELLRRDFKEMQTNLLQVMQDNTLIRDELREVQGQLCCMEHALMDRLVISFAPPRDVPDDSETDDNPDD